MGVGGNMGVRGGKDGAWFWVRNDAGLRQKQLRPSGDAFPPHPPSSRFPTELSLVNGEGHRHSKMNALLSRSVFPS